MARIAGKTARAQRAEGPTASLPAPSLDGGGGDKGFVVIQPLHWLSRLQVEATALQLEVGRAYAVGIGGSWPKAEAIAGLRARLERSLRLLARAESMDAGPAERFPEEER